MADLGIPAVNANKALWEKGDFTRIAATMRKSGEELVASLGIGPGTRVLDVGCGDGTTAIPAAMRGADVIGVDIASNLVAAGNARAQAAGLNNIQFLEGDASRLTGIDDLSFDVVVSIFWAMFAPRPFDVAKELVRVTRHGGRIIMGNWIPGDDTLVAQILKISSAYTPAPPEGFVSPMTWGDESQVRERFGTAGIAAADIFFSRVTYVFRQAGSPENLLETFRHYYGPVMNAYESAAKQGRADQLHEELTRLFVAQNRGGVAETYIPATYLRTTINRK